MAAATRDESDPGTQRPLGVSTVDPAEIARFAAIAEEWWDPDGKFRPLHRFNPVRLQWLRDRIAGRFGPALGRDGIAFGPNRIPVRLST